MSNPVSMEIQRLPLWDKLRSRRVPLSFDLELTARCNNDCRHCYICLPPGDDEARQRELTAAEIDDLAAQAVKLGAVWCLVTGGEPLLRPDFEAIYLNLKRRGLLVSAFTNATLITSQHIELFKKYPPRDLEITVYGVTPQTYRQVTRTGHFEKFRQGLDLLLENNVPVRLKAVPIQSNLAEYEQIAQFCRSRTKDYYRFDPQLHLRFDGDVRRNRDIRAERLTPEQVVALERADEKRMDVFMKSCDSLINEDLAHVNCNHLFHCGAGQGSFNISYDGQFRLCAPLWCPAHAYLETGEMDGPTPYFCSVAKARARVLQGDEPRV